METRKAKTRTVAMVVLCGILAYALIATGGSLEPSAPPGPIMKTLDEVEPRIPIQSLSGGSTCQYLITQSGSYYLTGDVTVTSTVKHGIQVDVNDVTIDLMGYTLKGPDSGTGKGIVMNVRSNVEVRNGTVRDFSRGISAEGGSVTKGHRVINVRAVSNGGVGIYLYGSAGHLIKDCTAVENDYNHGIYVGSGCTVTGNTVYGNGGYGIYSYGGGNTVTGNTTYNNGGTGIAVGSGSTVTGNTAYYNGGNGINASGGSTVTGNTAYYNQNYGIYPGSNCLVDQNTAYMNNQSGGSYTDISSNTSNVYGINRPDIHP